MRAATFHIGLRLHKVAHGIYLLGEGAAKLMVEEGASDGECPWRNRPHGCGDRV